MACLAARLCVCNEPYSFLSLLEGPRIFSQYLKLRTLSGIASEVILCWIMNRTGSEARLALINTEFALTSPCVQKPSRLRICLLQGDRQPNPTNWIQISGSPSIPGSFGACFRGRHLETQGCLHYRLPSDLALSSPSLGVILNSSLLASEDKICHQKYL